MIIAIVTRSSTGEFQRKNYDTEDEAQNALETKLDEHRMAGHFVFAIRSKYTITDPTGVLLATMEIERGVSHSDASSSKALSVASSIALSLPPDDKP